MRPSIRCAAAVALVLGLSSCASVNLREPRPLLCAVFGSAIGAGAGAWADGSEAAAGVGIVGAVAGYYACKDTAPKATPRQESNK